MGDIDDMDIEESRNMFIDKNKNKLLAKIRFDKYLVNTCRLHMK